MTSGICGNTRFQPPMSVGWLRQVSELSTPWVPLIIPRTQSLTSRFVLATPMPERTRIKGRHMKRTSKFFRVAAFVILGTALSATLAFADDQADNDPRSTVSSPPPLEFAPMTRSERFSRYLGGLGDGESILRAAGSAAIAQASNTPKEWGGGGEAFGKRLGNAYAEHVIHRTLQYGISAALHEDNRYFVSGQTGFFRRTKYAIASTMLARHDNGSRSFSFSRFGSAAGAAFISREWQPRSTTSAGDGAVSFGVTMATDLGVNMFREFWPSLKHHTRKE
jgi:hypothetical protein